MINSFRNKIEAWWEICKDVRIDIGSIDEIKIDSYLSDSLLKIDRYQYPPFRQDLQRPQIILYFWWTTPFFYKQSIFDPRFENCLTFSKKSPQKIV